MKTETGQFTVFKAEDGRDVALAMQSLWVTGRVTAVGAHLFVTHLFRSAEPGPVEVVYAFGLPQDAALRRFRMEGKGFKVHSELRPTAEAHGLYEGALDQGHLAALAHTYRGGWVNLTVGNLRPSETVQVVLELVAGVALSDDGLRLRFPFCLAPVYHRQARTVESQPGVGEMELPAAEFDDLILPRWMSDTSNLHRVGFDLAVSLPGPIAEIGSPSHPVRVLNTGTGECRVGLSRESDVPDRDLVLDIRSASTQVRIAGGRKKSGASWATVVVPSACFGEAPTGPRRVVFLLDRSGSMQGPVFEQARKALLACLAALRSQDRFAVAVFNNSTSVGPGRLQPATAANRARARQFLESIHPSDGTELALGVRTAVELLEGEAGDLFVLTDGQVGGTEEVLAEVRKQSVRLHCLGIGSASQDRFITLLARETGGVGRFVTPRERVDEAALELFSVCGICVADSLRARVQEANDERVVGTPPVRVFAGHPLVVMLEGRSGLAGPLELEWESEGQRHTWSTDIAPGSSRDADTVRLLQGARLITDLDALLGGEPGTGVGDKKQRQRVERKLEALGKAYGLANRALSLVAVVKRRGDTGSRLPRTLVVPVGMPENVHLGAYFASASGAGTRSGLRGMQANRLCCFVMPEEPQETYRSMDLCLDEENPLSSPRRDAVAEQLMTHLADIADDGGLPGPDAGTRVLRSLLLVDCLLQEGSSPNGGRYREHVRRLVTFLESMADQVPDARRQETLRQGIEFARRGLAFPGATMKDLLEALDQKKSPARIEPWWETLAQHFATGSRS